MKKLLFVLSVILFYSCNQEPTKPDKIVKPETEINKLVWTAGKVNTSVIDDKNMIYDSLLKNVPEEGKLWNIKKTKWSLATNLDKNIIPFNPNANTLWAGALVQGKEVPNGILNSLGDNISRTPITITVESGGKLFGTSRITNPTKARYSLTLSSILSGVSGNTTANMTLKKNISYSEKQACNDLKIGFNWLIGSGFESHFKTTNTCTKKTFFIFFKQEYYTVSVNEPSMPSDYFADDVNTNVLNYNITNGNPLCYVASVTYGRLLMVKMTYTGYESTSTVENELNAAFNVVNEKFNYTNRDIIENSDFVGIILGGSADNGASALTGGDIQSVLNFINDGANYSSNSPGYPISYTVKNMADNSIVKLGETTDYEVKEYTESEENYQNFDIELKGFWVMNDCEPYGDGDFFYNLDITDNNNNSLIDGEISIPETQTVPAGDGTWIYFKGQSKYSFTLSNSSGSYFRVKGSIAEYNSWVDNIVVDFDKKFFYPWNTTDITNNWKIGNETGFYGLEMFRDAGCKIVLILKITKK